MNDVGWFAAGFVWALLFVVLLVLYGMHRLGLLDEKDSDKK